MDIGQFYDDDDRRRQSAEIELGTEWRDSQGVRYELNWIEDTGELYVMREPAPPAWEDPFGDIYVRTSDRAPITGMTVVVIAHIEERERLEEILKGWPQAMDRADSVSWLAKRLKSAGVAERSEAGDPS